MFAVLTSTDYKKIQKNFLDELIRASRNQSSSISYLHHNFPNKQLLQSGLVQAFVIGGTNFSVGLARILNGTIKEIKREREQGKIPQFTNAETFLKFMKNHFNPKAQALAVNFSHKLEPTIGKFGEVDGKLQVGAKEHTFKGLIGKQVGEAVRTYIKKDIPVTVANDTVCLGKNGLVIGTGFNMCLQNVNLEAGAFNKLPTTEELETIDMQSAVPGDHRFEKLLSGTYLPLHFNLLAKKQQLAIDHVQNGEELTDLAENDLGVAGDLARALFTRSASLVACALAAAYAFSKHKTLTFITEGSLFWKGWQFETNVKKQLEELGIPHGTIRFKKVEDSSMQGAFNLLTRIV